MSLALRRFRLDSIGPPGARFDPLAVDLASADDGRAAGTSVLFLENGGGKSVLLRLLFSVVLPGRRYTVGSVKLDGYVGSGDTGHVVLEWDTADGPVVTGTLLEWRNRTRSSSGSNLLQFWYSFRPRPGVLGLTELPIRDGDRRVSRAGFRERLSTLAREHPELELVIEDSPTKWADHLLRSTPVDPEIFRYQRQMNADEADAESLFAGLKTDEDFVRFVVEAVQDPEQFDGFGELLVEYATQLERREEREVEARFCEAAAEVLRPLGAAYHRLAEASNEETAARRASDRLRARLTAGADQAEAGARRFRETAEAAADRGRRLSNDAQHLADTAAELRWREARFRHQAADEACREARDRADRATLVASAWEKVWAVVDFRKVAAELGELRTAQERQEHELAPLRQAMEQAATRYAGRLLAEAEGLEQEAASAEAEASDADEGARRLASRHDDCQREAGEATADARSFRKRVREVDEAVAAARSDGVLGQAESVSEGCLRTEREHEEATAALGQLRSRYRTVEQQRRDLVTRVQAAQGEEIRVDNQLTRAREELDGHQAAADRLLAHSRVPEIVPDADDAWMVSERLEQVLDEAVRAYESRERTLRARIQDLEERLEQMGADGLLPAAPDVAKVWDAVVAAGIAAATGWSHLDRNLDAEGRARVLAANPGLAGGVIVTDPDLVAKAERAVVDAGVETESVVLIGTADELDQPGAGRAAPVRRALYDRNWTARVRKELEAERDGLVEDLGSVASRLGVDGPLLGEVRDFRRRCSPQHRDDLVSDVTRLDGQVASLRETIAQVEAKSEAAAEELASLERDEPGCLARSDATGEACRRLAGLRDQEERKLDWAQQAKDADERQGRLVGEARRLNEQAEEARRQAEQARIRARRARADASSRRQEARQLGVEADVPLPLAGAEDAEPAEDGQPAGSAEPAEGVDPEVTAGAVETTEILKGTYEAAKEVYEAERAGRDLTSRIEQVEATREARGRELAELAPDVVREAEALANLPGADDATSRQARTAEAREAVEQAGERLNRGTRELGAAEKTLEERQPKGKAHFISLDPETEPADADAAARAAAEHQDRAFHTGRKAREANDAAAHRMRQAQDAEGRADLLRATLEVLPVPLGSSGADLEGGEAAIVGDVDGGPERRRAETSAGDERVAPWDRGTDDAADAARDLRERHDRAVEALRLAERALERADAEVRRVAADPALARVGGVRLALANEPRDHLAGRAGALADEVDAMRQSVEEELAEALRHREGIVQRLATLVEGQLRQLKLLTRLSILPPGLGEWSGKPFVSVDFDQVPAGELTARLGPIVDEAAAEPRRRAALDLVLAGMRAAVLHRHGDTEKTFTVRLLRPNRMMSFQRASVGELEGEFSGGMKLTAAICTYCALAALRANCRSTGSLFGVDPGPLFLDNPLGKASADYLLELQHAIAEKLGVQLVHTTGVWDVEALATYERVVRLRNMADLRRNVSRLRVDDDVNLPGAGATVDAVSFAIRRDGG